MPTRSNPARDFPPTKRRPDAWSEFNRVIHGIEPDDVRGAPNFAAVWPQLAALATDAPFVAHYACFDLCGLRAELARHELEPPPILTSHLGPRSTRC